MKEIVLVKKEIKQVVETIEIPDYQPKLDKIDELSKIKQEIVIERTKTVQILSDSIINQVACYLCELLQPIMAYKNTPKSSLNWYSSYWELYYVNGVFKLNCNTSKFAILFIPDDKCGLKWMVDCVEQNKDEAIISLTNNWHSIKRNTIETIEFLIEKLKREQEGAIEKNNKIIDSLINFKL